MALARSRAADCRRDRGSHDRRRNCSRSSAIMNDDNQLILNQDQKGLSSGRKPDITHVRTSLMIYIARACEYGSDKYYRANYLQSVGTDIRDNFKRVRSYLRACLSHITATLDKMEYHQALDPYLDDADGMRIAAYAEDMDSELNSLIGPSGLPHIAHAAASLMMAIEQAVYYNVLPADPGQPWRKK